jgi:proteasome lid subunit RPN8/RPN11
MAALRMTTSVADAIRRHAERAYPDECCGALLGRDDERAREVAAALPVPNRREGSAARNRFLITAAEYRALEHEARMRALDIVGFYHSHPDHPPQPSDYDREHALPWYSYLIVSVRAGRGEGMTSWVLRDDRSGFSEEVIDHGHEDTGSQRA